MMCDERLFAPQVSQLHTDYNVSVGDITAADNMHDLAVDVLKKAPEQFALCGLSMGGIVAMEIYRQAPQRVDAIAFLDTSPLAEVETVKASRQPQIERVQSGCLAKVMRDELKPKYLANGPSKQFILKLCMDMALDLGPDTFSNQSLALRERTDQQETLRRIDVPTLVLCGREDQLCSVEKHKLMHKLVPNSQFVVVEKAGHLPTLEQPEETAVHLHNWLENSRT